MLNSSILDLSRRFVGRVAQVGRLRSPQSFRTSRSGDPESRDSGFDACASPRNDEINNGLRSAWPTRRYSPAAFEPGTPWLLRYFDRISFYPVSADELLDLRADMA
ncbi:MAG: hypothetical protein ACREDP_00270, partial [Bradyrhizobium sp.]